MQNSGFRVEVFERGSDLSVSLADRICCLVADRAAKNQGTVLGLMAGVSAGGVYRTLGTRCRSGRLDPKRLLAVAPGEFYPVGPKQKPSLARQMLDAVTVIGLPKKQLLALSGNLKRERVARHCAEYEEAIGRAGGIDLQLLGLGVNGRFVFNEPGSSPICRTRLVDLDEITRHDLSGRFGGIEHTPRKAITLGIATVMEAREIAIIAAGIHKAAIVRRIVERPPTTSLPVSLLKQHPAATLYLDKAAASLL